VHRPLPEDDPRQRRPDILKAQKNLGWEPRTPLKAGLAKTIAYFETLLQLPYVKEMLNVSK
jgi:nucleoside-diphosphate-sugar epimerase